MWKLLNEDIKTKFSDKIEVLYEKCDEQNAWLKYKSSVRKRVWKKHMEAIMNEENPWDGMVNVKVVEGPMEPFAMNEVERVLGFMKNGKASGTTGIVKEHLAAFPHFKQVILQIANEILNGMDIPHD